MNKEDNNKYAVNPDVLKRIKYNKRDRAIRDEGGEFNSGHNIFIQGVVATPPEQWTDRQLAKAKKSDSTKGLTSNSDSCLIMNLAVNPTGILFKEVRLVLLRIKNDDNK